MPEFTNDFVGLPMEELIGAPLSAATKAQLGLCKVMVAGIKELAYIGGDETKGTAILKFDIERPIIDDKGATSLAKVSLQPPQLALVPIPALLVEDVTIDFEMEVKAHTQTKAEVTAKIETTASGGGWFLPKFSVTGSVSTHAENTRSTDKSAKYTVHVSARQQPPPEGLAKLLQAMASAVEPYKIGGGSGGGGGKP